MTVQTESRTALRELIDLLAEVDQRWAGEEWGGFVPSVQADGGAAATGADAPFGLCFTQRELFAGRWQGNDTHAFLHEPVRHGISAIQAPAATAVGA